jgi:hypothetical protein
MGDYIPTKPEEIRFEKRQRAIRLKALGQPTRSLFDQPARERVDVQIAAKSKAGNAAAVPRTLLVEGRDTDRSSHIERRARKRSKASARSQCGKSDTSKWLAQLQTAAYARAGRRKRSKVFFDRIANAQDDQKRINLVYYGEEIADHGKVGFKVPLPGLIDQVEAADQRIWRTKEARKLRRKQRLELKKDPVLSRLLGCHCYAVTLLRKEWILPNLDPALLKKMRKQVQRQAKRLVPSAVVTGVIDVCPIDDQVSGTTGWGFHVHLTIQLAAQNAKEGRVAIRKAFPNQPAPEHGVYRGCHVKKSYDPTNWDRYQDKLFQLDGVRQWVVRLDPSTGNRLKANKPPLTSEQLRDLVKFMALIEADDLMIWVGHRRYGDRVLKIGM